ncbi:hypothetical protein Pla108_41950 [Botrimarina colliarenosi]|uniref:Uncharacterized protein n=1 Tax=Botrimarina colliarenosi TaxID=2528001 RepID=A0A5C5ZXB5_9BACT|nr:hypothetical protein Pla108_41950 [Botrimarina colliarenosi]
MTGEPAEASVSDSIYATVKPHRLDQHRRVARRPNSLRSRPRLDISAPLPWVFEAADEASAAAVNAVGRAGFKIIGSRLWCPPIAFKDADQVRPKTETGGQLLGVISWGEPDSQLAEGAIAVALLTPSIDVTPYFSNGCAPLAGSKPVIEPRAGSRLPRRQESQKTLSQRGVAAKPVATMLCLQLEAAPFRKSRLQLCTDSSNQSD